MTAKKMLPRSEFVIERETIEVLEENKLKIREVWKKLWSRVWITSRNVTNVLMSPLASQLVLIIEEGKTVKAFDPKYELLKKTLVL